MKSSIPGKYLEGIELAIRETRQEVISSRTQIQASAFLINDITNDVVRVNVSTADEAAKDESARLLRLMAKEHGATAVLLIMESWMLPMKMMRDPEIAFRELEKYGSVSAHPKRVEIVAFTLECAEGYWLGRSPILHIDAKRTRSFLEVTWQRGDSAQGRFGSFLGPEQAEISPTKEGTPTPGESPHDNDQPATRPRFR